MNAGPERWGGLWMDPRDLPALGPRSPGLVPCPPTSARGTHPYPYLGGLISTAPLGGRRDSRAGDLLSRLLLPFPDLPTMPSDVSRPSPREKGRYRPLNFQAADVLVSSGLCWSLRLFLRRGYGLTPQKPQSQNHSTCPPATPFLALRCASDRTGPATDGQNRTGQAMSSTRQT